MLMPSLKMLNRGGVATPAGKVLREISKEDAGGEVATSAPASASYAVDPHPIDYNNPLVKLADLVDGSVPGKSNVF